MMLQSTASGFTWFGSSLAPRTGIYRLLQSGELNSPIGKEIIEKYRDTNLFNFIDTITITDVYAKRGKYGICYCFTYQFDNGDDEMDAPSFVSVMLYEGNCFFPHLSISRGISYETLGFNLSMKVLQLDSVDFNSRWQVASTDPQFAYSFLDPIMMEYIDQLKVGRIVVYGTGIFFVNGGMEDMTSYLPIMEQFIEHIPKFVAKDHAVTKPQRPLGGVNI